MAVLLAVVTVGGSAASTLQQQLLGEEVDRIYVMQHGRIVEAGSHESLMAIDGLYAELFSLQARAYI